MSSRRVKRPTPLRGRALFVCHPDFVAVSNRQVIVVNAQDESVSWTEPLQIASIEYAAKSPTV